MNRRSTRTTIARTGTVNGFGLQLGTPCSATLYSAARRQVRENVAAKDRPSGICFRRMDLPNQPEIWGDLQSRDPASFRTTNLRRGDATVGTVEHLLAAFKICGIDDAVVELTGPEVPICDGSALKWVETIKKCGRLPIPGQRRILIPKKPIFVTLGSSTLIAMPSAEWRISCLIHYPQSPLIACQYLDVPFDSEAMGQMIAPARTFCLFEEVAALHARGAMLGGSLETALVIQGDRVLNSDGLRFGDEMVRHKVLDVIGDLALLNADLCAHLIALCPSHEANAALAHKIQAATD